MECERELHGDAAYCTHKAHTLTSLHFPADDQSCCHKQWSSVPECVPLTELGAALANTMVTKIQCHSFLIVVSCGMANDYKWLADSGCLLLPGLRIQKSWEEACREAKAKLVAQ